MRHFQYASDRVDSLFAVKPSDFSDDWSREVAAIALGATLYTPSVHPELQRVVRKALQYGVTTSVMCLEDSTPDHRVEEGRENILKTLEAIALDTENEYPQLFIRVRSPEYIHSILGSLSPEARNLVRGFCLPKFDNINGVDYIWALKLARNFYGRIFYGLPILESTPVIYHETRRSVLHEIHELLDENKDYILNVRIGATDLLGSYGLRRSSDMTIYDVHVVASVIGAIINTFGRFDGTGFVISGPVWEHFGDRKRLFNNELRNSPFAASESKWLRSKLIRNDLDKLLRETELDQANGIIGKTIIHPSHAVLVNGMLTVSYDEYQDALSIVDGGTGVHASSNHIKMNEVKPHSAWANRTLQRALVYGVLDEGVNVTELLKLLSEDDQEN